MYLGSFCSFIYFQLMEQSVKGLASFLRVAHWSDYQPNNKQFIPEATPLAWLIGLVGSPGGDFICQRNFSRSSLFWQLLSRTKHRCRFQSRFDIPLS